MTEKKYNNIILVISILLISVVTAFTIFMFINNFKIKDSLVPTIITETVIDEVYFNSVTRLKINEKIQENIDFYINEYTKITQNIDVARIIIEQSIEENVPVNLMLALSFIESRFNPQAINRNSYSTDWGLFQLNDTVYNFLSQEDFFNIEINTSYAIDHLKDIYNRYNYWEIAVLFYNSGSINNTGIQSLNHMSKILIKEREYDLYFNNLIGVYNNGVN